MCEMIMENMRRHQLPVEWCKITRQKMSVDLVIREYVENTHIAHYPPTQKPPQPSKRLSSRRVYFHNKEMIRRKLSYFSLVLQGLALVDRREDGIYIIATEQLRAIVFNEAKKRPHVYWTLFFHP